MQGFDGLVKEIDSLTYNARSVLNALIRSVMRTGSSSGYTVTRKVNSVSYTITLTRGDIYILSQFYAKWEESNFSADAFVTARKYADGLTYYAEPAASDSGSASRSLLTAQATPAIVKHSEILFLSASNVSNYTSDPATMTSAQTEYWHGLVQGYSNPLLITNSCPVPVNLRTPAFDSTLSTRHYSQYETYLFPFGYYAMDILGYSGDGKTHSAGGNIWNITGDTSVGFVSPRVMLGDASSSVKDRASDGVYSTAWGLNTFPYGDYSTAGGSYCVVSETGNSGVSLGSGNAVSAPYGSAVGGTDNISSGYYGAVAGGYSNIVSGTCGLAGNRMTAVGGYPYRFSITQRTETTGTCQYVATSESCTATVTTDTMGYNRLYVYADDPWFNDMLTENPATAFAANYKVILYGWQGASGGGPAHISTPLLDSIETTVTSVASASGGGCYVTLASSVSGDVYGGMISVYSVSNSDTYGRGYASTAFGLGTLAGGFAQTVVGKYNQPLYGIDDYNFIVGCGTETAHINSLISGAAGTLISHTYMNGDYPWEIAYVHVTGDDRYGHANMMAMTYVSVTSSYLSSMYLTGESAELSSVYVSGTTAAVGGRLSLCSDGSRLFSAMLSSSTGLVGLVASKNNLEYVENKGIGYYGVGGQFVSIPSAPYSVGVLGTYVSVTAENNLNLTSYSSIWMEFGSLQLRGDTYGTLAADCYARSFPVANYVHTAYPGSAHSGFYFTTASTGSNVAECGANIVSAYASGNYVYGFELASTVAYNASGNINSYIGLTLPVTAWIYNVSASTSTLSTRYLVTTDYVQSAVSTINTAVSNLATKVDTTCIADLTAASGLSDYIANYMTYDIAGVKYARYSDVIGLCTSTHNSLLKSTAYVGWASSVTAGILYTVATMDGYVSGSGMYVATSYAEYGVVLGSQYIHMSYESAIKWGMLTGYGYSWNLAMHMNLYVLSRAICPYVDYEGALQITTAGVYNDISVAYSSHHLAPAFTTSGVAESATFYVSHAVLPGVSSGGYITYATMKYDTHNDTDGYIWNVRFRTTASSFTALFAAGADTSDWHFTVPVIAQYVGG